MIMKPFNHTYFLAPVLFIGIAIGLYFLMRNKKDLHKNILIGVLMGVNILQHLLKGFIWPGYERGFAAENTAINVCACLILIAPIAYFVKWKPLNQCSSMVGICAGMGALLYPYWFWNKTIFDWEYLRFTTCHGILFLTSILPLLFKLVKVNFKDFHYVGAYFEAVLLIIFFNYMIITPLGLLGNEGNFIYQLKRCNPFLIGGPTPGGTMDKIFRCFTPGFLMNCPILWYAIPLYISITILAFIVFMIMDRPGFKSYFARYKKKEVE